MTEQCRRVKAFPPRAKLVGGPSFAYFVYPCDVLPEFTQAIKEILHGSASRFSVDSVLAMPWDVKETVLQRDQWIVETWQSVWASILRKQSRSLSVEGGHLQRGIGSTTHPRLPLCMTISAVLRG